MIYKLKNEVDSHLSATEQILVNRGIRQSDVKHYLNTTDKDINSPLAFGELSEYGLRNLSRKQASVNSVPGVRIPDSPPSGSKTRPAPRPVLKAVRS